MKNSDEKIYCRLCNEFYTVSEMSEEHVPARSVGNVDIVKFDIVKMVEMLQSGEVGNKIRKKQSDGYVFKEIVEEIFDNQLTEPLFPKGRTFRTLCIKCNNFLGNYDQAYLKFFQASGNPEKIRGFQVETKYKIIKSIFAKFLSISESADITFDFLDFIRRGNSKDYAGEWHLYFVKRNLSTDIIGFKDLTTGKLDYDEGVVLELSDDKFIYNLMNFEKHDEYQMTNIFDILSGSYKLVEGLGEDGGYHAQILMEKSLSNFE